MAEELIARWSASKERLGTLGDIARLLELAHKLARLASDMPTEVTKSEARVEAKLDVNWQEAFAKVFPNSTSCESHGVACSVSVQV